MKVKTTSGFECELDAENLDDIRVLELIAGVDEGKAFLLPKLFKRVLGAEQAEALYSFIEQKEGRASVEAATNAFAEIVGAINEGKNS